MPLLILQTKLASGMMSFSRRVQSHALLAQLAEQLTLNQRVSGSSPEGGSLNLMETTAESASDAGSAILSRRLIGGSFLIT